MVPLFTVRVKVLRLLIGIHCYLAISNHALTPTPNKKVIIVGGGVGGLSIAARIAPLAREVHIFEKNARIGGRCGSFHVSVPYINGTFRHEYGPSLLLLPHVYEQLFTDCGTTAQACGLEMKQCVPAYQCVFDDGDCILVGYPDDATTSSSSGKNRFRKEILESRQKMDSFEPGGAKRWDEYMAACQAYLDCGLPNFIEQRLDLASFPAFLRQALGGFGKAWPLKPHSDVLDAIFQSDKMKAMASFQDLYVGLEPFRNDQQIFGGITDTTAPAVFGLLSAIELHPSNSKCGVFAPIGGFRAVTMAMEKLARELGVHIHCNTTVTKVTDNGVYFCDKIDESGRTNEFAEADLVIVNADLPYAASCLIQDDLDPTIPHFDWTNKRNSADLRFSSGVIAFHWSLDKELVDLNTHNVFLASGSREGAVQSWQALRDNQDDFSDGAPFNFYVHRASMTDATAAPLVRAFSLLLLCFLRISCSQFGSLFLLGMRFSSCFSSLQNT